MDLLYPLFKEWLPSPQAVHTGINIITLAADVATSRQGPLARHRYPLPHQHVAVICDRSVPDCVAFTSKQGCIQGRHRSGNSLRGLFGGRAPDRATGGAHLASD